MTLPHVIVEEIDGRVVVRVPDHELFDFIEDHLSESYGLFAEWVVRMEEMHFPLSIHREQIDQALRELPRNEVERIWRLNNRSS